MQLQVCVCVSALVLPGRISSNLKSMCDFRLQPPCRSDLRSSRILLSVQWKLLTDVSGQPIGSVCKGQEIKIPKPLQMGTTVFPKRR